MYLIENFATTKNMELAAHLGCGESTLHRTARKMGLKKDREFMMRLNSESLAACHAANRGTGNSGKKNLLKHGVKYRFKKGERPVDRLGEEGERRRIEKLRKTRNELIRKERMRINWGLPQHTNIKLGSRTEHIPMRYQLRLKGYIAARGAKVIYYNNDTQRSALMEKHATAMGLTFEPCT